MTAAEMAAESDISESRILAQVQAREAVEGTGQFADIVLGSSETEFRERARHTVNRIYAGGSVLTVFHEDTHGFFREAIKAGRLTREETITTLRAFQTVLGGKTRDGTPLRLLPDGEVNDVQLDEAVAEFMEAEILRTRRTGRHLPPGILARNLTAAAKLAPGATAKFARFVKTVREYFGVALHRSVAIQKGIRDGTIQEADIDAFTTKLFGLDGMDASNPNTDTTTRNTQTAAAASESTIESLQGSAFSIAPIGPGIRQITEAPPVLAQRATPFAGETATTPSQWRPVWKAWLASHPEWFQTVDTPEGPIAITNQSADHARFVRAGERAALHFEAVTRLPELLAASKLANVDAPKPGEKGAAEIHRRYAWMDFADGQRRHVLLTVKRWAEDADIDFDSAYSVEAIEVQESAADGKSSPSALADSRADTGDATGTLSRFLSGIKAEHKVDATNAASPDGTMDIAPSSGTDRTRASETSDPSFSLSAVPGGFQFASEDARRQVEDAAFAAAKRSGVVNTDDVRPLIPGYADADPLTRDARFHDAASSITTRIIDRMLAGPSDTGRVLILAGGGGSGKSTGASRFADDVDFTFDFTLSDPGFARELLQKIRSSGREAQILYVHRRFAAALDNIIGRYLAEKSETGRGRIVPLDVAVRAHVGAQETILGLAGVPVQVVDNNGGIGESHLITLEKLAEKRYVEVDEREGIAGSSGSVRQKPQQERAERRAEDRSGARRGQAEESLRKEGEGILRALRDAGDLTDAEFAAFLGRDDS